MELTYLLLLCLQSFICVSFILCLSKPHIFIFTSFNCIFIRVIFEINFVFIERRLRVILTLTSLLTINLAILKLLKLSNGNLIASTTTISKTYWVMESRKLNILYFISACCIKNIYYNHYHLQYHMQLDKCRSSQNS